jgi:hypothetical protein
MLVMNSVLEVIFNCICSDSYQWNMATWPEEWSKHESWVVMRFSNESNMSAEKYVVKQPNLRVHKMS